MTWLQGWSEAGALTEIELEIREKELAVAIEYKHKT